MSRSPCHWTLSCLPSSFLSSSFNFYFYFFGLSSLYTIHTLIQSLQIKSPPATWRPKKIFFNIQGRQVAGETSDLVGCVCVCALCVCRLVVLFHFLCLSSLSIHSLSPLVQLSLLFFLSLQEQHC